MQFNRIRLSGFKSFVEPTELFIEPGLTGIVGPNGCGKSNLVEAMRWVMGETSAKRIRGTGMEDVIFAGSGNRPARNLAEVSILVDNHQRKAPSAYNDDTEIEVVRRIERDSGSHFTVNGREARARDVQRLFADAASGAHSTALVSQGEIGALVKAKPEDRRLLIEEAAGITGLHSRRHEAELRLRAAETNLERLADVMATLEGQLQGLKRQSRQATRYRNLSGHIRKAEATLLYVTWRLVVGQLQTARSELEDHERGVATITESVARATSALEAAASALPPLRQSEAEAAAKVHRLDVAGEQLNNEEQRVLHERMQLDARRTQIEADAQRELARVEDAASSTARLTSEREEIERSQDNEENAFGTAAMHLRTKRGETSAIEQELAAWTEQLAESEAERRSLRVGLENVVHDLVRLNERRIAIRDQRDLLIGRKVDSTFDDTPNLAALQQSIQLARRDHVDAAETLEARRSAETDARETFRTIETEVSRLGAEEAALASLLGDEERDLWPALIDAVTVQAGYEAALASALGDELSVAADIAAPAHWREITTDQPAPPLPGEAVPISQFITAPNVLSRRLSQIGIVDDEEIGASLQAQLQQGQRLVSRNGGLWRWDGYTVTSDSPTMALNRLNQRTRLRELRAELENLRPTFDQKRQRTLDAKAASDLASTNEARAHQALLDTEELLFAKREAIAESQREATEHQAHILSLANALEEISAAERPLNERRREILAKLRLLPEIGSLRLSSDRTRLKLDMAREQLNDAQATHARLEHDAKARSARYAAITAEQEIWRNREAEARTQLSELDARRNETAAAFEQIMQRPADIQKRRESLLIEIETAEHARRDAADRLAIAETAEAGCNEELKRRNELLAQAREEKIRREGHTAQLEEREREVGRRTHDALDCTPEDARDIAELKDEADLPELEATETRLQRLLRERENMGPVNLRAEQEAAEVGEQLQTLLDERADLEAAISRLRQGISSLNREGRERLLAAFAKVDANFQELFKVLFGGGRAHLSLTDADDPLDAGVEIMASPPGKRMQILTLLSGGEQALTAIALLVAVFQTNPAPICVLDEVDAPLDEANVERFCELIGTISKQTDTRFLVVTHNSVTMARVDRLYGVTMAEQGVSQLVSVDLFDAEELRATA